jgi:radical SAM superfamily enzyme YgiQ (UPF0313 family)
MDREAVLLINPWIHDFAAYDFWLRPIGLLRLATMLRGWGFDLHLVDCLDRHNPRLLERLKASPLPSKPDGRGKFHKEEIPGPSILKDIPRRYSRYGIPPDIFLDELSSLPKPSIILVTSSMTYWYPGIQETISLTKRVFPDVKIVLGGTYATLMPDHARAHSGVDYVVEGRDFQKLRGIFENFVGRQITPGEDNLSVEDDVTPAYELLRNTSSMVIFSSWGCPFRCSYCASWKISGPFRQRDPVRVVDEIELLWEKHQTRHFVFFDDALLFASERHFQPILREVIARKVKAAFHTPNAIHPRYVDREVAGLMREANFQTVCLGLETTSADTQQRTGAKVSSAEFGRAVEHLAEASFPRREIEVYAMMGLPGQDTEEVRETLRFINDQGCTIRLAVYSPIPGTEEWNRAVAASDLPLASDPLFHNCSIYPVRTKTMTWQVFDDLKALASDLNSSLRIPSPPS